MTARPNPPLPSVYPVDHRKSLSTSDLHRQVRNPLGRMLIVFAVGNVVAVVLLGAAFGWPAVLSEQAAVALTRFADNQTAVVAGFYLFAVLSVLMIPISIAFHRLTVAGGELLAPTVTAFGILGGVFQLMGWIRWPFAIPDLARSFLDPAATGAQRAAVSSSYDLINSYAGRGLGEHLGWLFQAGWGMGMVVLVLRTGVLSRALALPGLVLTALWAIPFLLGPSVTVLGGDAVATVGFAAYGLWFGWNGLVGIAMLRRIRLAG